MLKGIKQAPWLALCLLLWSACAQAYQVMITEHDETRQVCSGMWGSGGTRDPYIEVVFSPGSTGSLALVIYEWQDAKYLGIDSDGGGRGANQWEDNRVFICTLAAQRANLCTSESLGQFIVTTPIDVSPNSTSIFTTPVRFTKEPGEDASLPQGSTGPFRYPVPSTGYYCVGAVPITFEQPPTELSAQGPETDPFESIAYTGVVDFQNVFKGHLPAAEYPKIGFYAFLTFIYIVVGLVWAYLCRKHKDGMLVVQKYVGVTIGFIVVEMLFIWAYYGYLNANGSKGLSNILLILVAVLNSARNALSFFLLCIVCMGYGVVRPSLGSVMTRVKGLAVVHFVFGILYSVGTVTVPLESAGLWIFFMVFPLAFSLTAFMMWTMWSLNATIGDLEARKQTFKKNMFVKLYRVLLGAVVVIAAFFVISSISFANRLDEDFAPDTWKTRWWLLDGWLSLLYFAVFCAIAWLWRPSDNNHRLAMSDELATDDVEDFEIDDLETGKDDGSPRHVGQDDVVFDIGEDDDETPGPRKAGAPHSADASGEERTGLTQDDRRHSNDEDIAPPAYRQ